MLTDRAAPQHRLAGKIDPPSSASSLGLIQATFIMFYGDTADTTCVLKEGGTWLLITVSLVNLTLPPHLTYLMQILRMLHVDRQGGTWRLLGSVVFIHRQVSTAGIRGV